MDNTAKIKKEYLNAAYTKGFYQITREAYSPLGNRNGTQAIEWVVSNIVFLPYCQTIAVQTKESAVTGNNKMPHFNLPTTCAVLNASRISFL